ncbi:8222_t:CDS:1, partial [Cetraspora pellucida]
DNEIRIGRIIVIVLTSIGIKLKVQFLYFGSKLPKNFLSSARAEESQNRELWLSEVTYLIDPSTVIGPVIVWLQDTSEPSD